MIRSTLICCNHKSFNVIALSALLLFSLLVSTVGSMSLAGKYGITEVMNSEGMSVALPKRFGVVIAPDQGGNSNKFAVSMKIGNSMSTGLTLEDGADTDKKRGASVGPVRSTMMMPPREVYEVEILLTEILPSVNSVELTDGDSVLTMEGGEGKVILEREGQ